ncbi:hypothetical protein BKA82DRAFT_26665 [Pisolithus tinctorius]|uniref:C2H2-type domain-containing protein n=1 Tax=Pisolithus tinctorius Marx 270 TaxID=870435 RepID=A0A0C3J4S1_PISTI|nr:hypothetical protein BKA82DRAFT_26665 [Pisolithus tinctorius]KIO04083.1 hypothetical protein M404DRAFT_26665 [Pisolithus tinctorius Marx 270]
MATSNGNGTPEHYDGPINPLNYALRGAVGTTYSQANANQIRTHSSRYEECPSVPCGCRNSSGMRCNVLVNCGSAPDHFRLHGIRDLNRSAPITCPWCGEQVKRNNAVRHIREVHLGHGRSAGR